MNKKVHFQIIENQKIQTIVWKIENSTTFIEANAQKHPHFGTIAQNLGEAPIKAIYTFLDGNIVGLRGDKYVFPNYVEMLRNLYKVTLKYWKDKKIYEAKIYDNRRLLPEEKILILHWKLDTGTITNLLPLYSGEFDLKTVKNKK